jgi:peptide/nickel transport system substrate-binding protein
VKKEVTFGLAAACLASSLTLGALGAVAAEKGEVTIVLPDSIDNLDPCRTARNDVGRILKQNVVETLTEIDPAEGTIRPRLATKWEKINDNTWRFHLREGVKFHDGAVFDAHAVAQAFARTMNPSMDCTVRQKFFGGVTINTKVVDPQTIEITTEPKQPILPTVLSAFAISAPKTPVGAPTNEPVGTGPYRLQSWKPGQEAVLVRQDSYWGEQPKVTRARFVYRGDSAVQAAMVQTGEADLAPYIAVQDATNPRTDISYLNTETAQVALTVDRPPLNDLRVRQALNMSVDRNAFIGTIFSADVKSASQLVLPFINGYDPAISPWPYDPNKAKALLAAAKADGVPVDQELILYGRPGFLPNQPDVLAALAQMWQAVGFKVRVQMIEKAQFIDLVSQPHEPNRPAAMFFNLHDNSNGDAASSLYFKYASKGGQSQTMDPELDRLIGSGMEASGDERRSFFRQAFQRITKEMVPDVILFHFVGYARVGPRIDYKPTNLTNNEIHLSSIRLKD